MYIVVWIFCIMGLILSVTGFGLVILIIKKTDDIAYEKLFFASFLCIAGIICSIISTIINNNLGN